MFISSHFFCECCYEHGIQQVKENYRAVPKRIEWSIYTSVYKESMFPTCMCFCVLIINDRSPWGFFNKKAPFAKWIIISINQQTWCSFGFFFRSVHLLITLLKPFPAINKNIGLVYEAQAMKSAKKFQFHAIIIKMLCFDFSSSCILLLFFLCTPFLML